MFSRWSMTLPACWLRSRSRPRWAGQGLERGLIAQRVEKRKGEPVDVDFLCRGLLSMVKGRAAVADEHVDDSCCVGARAVVGGQPQGLLDRCQALLVFSKMGEGLGLDSEHVPVAGS